VRAAVVDHGVQVGVGKKERKVTRCKRCKR
jgi:hypothetical protein